MYDVCIIGSRAGVAAQAIETSRLLLNSKNKYFPNGLANFSGELGKNLYISDASFMPIGGGRVCLIHGQFMQTLFVWHMLLKKN